MVAATGDWRLLTLDIHLNRMPSRAMAKRMRGRGNMQPNRLEGRSFMVKFRPQWKTDIHDTRTSVKGPGLPRPTGHYQLIAGAPKPGPGGPGAEPGFPSRLLRGTPAGQKSRLGRGPRGRERALAVGSLVPSQAPGGSAGALDPPRLSPATKPEVIVAMRGVFVFGLIWAKALKSTPSSAIAKITRGIGKMEPSRLSETAETCETKN